MCHAITSILRTINVWVTLILLASVITLLSTFPSPAKSFVSVNNMPVTTRSMAKGGLQDDTNPVLLPSSRLTCNNAITNTPDYGDVRNLVLQVDYLPELIHQSTTTPSSLEADSCSLESTINFEFDISNFENSKLLPIISLPVLSTSNSSQFSLMESDCREEPSPLMPSSSTSSNDEILKLLTAISSQMVVGHQDLQNQLLSSNVSLKAELEKVREENEQFKQEMRTELTRTVTSNTQSTSPRANVILSSPTLTTAAPYMVPASTSSSPVDFQSQMLTVLNDTFARLSSLPTWEVISESQFQSLSKGVKALPSMAIATIKFDNFNRPKRAKYRIVILGNHDYHTWSKESTAAPVMSQLELHHLTSLAISQKRYLKNCDIKQAFVQSSLPDDEHYFVRPPKNCPRSTPGTYWHLLRSLYGLRRAPILWFDKLSSHLKSMGLQQSPTSPCIFVGTLI
jgi:hypothetical protein